MFNVKYSFLMYNPTSRANVHVRAGKLAGSWGTMN